MLLNKKEKIEIAKELAAEIRNSSEWPVMPSVIVDVVKGYMTLRSDLTGLCGDSECPVGHPSKYLEEISWLDDDEHYYDFYNSVMSRGVDSLELFLVC
jgi:hypothetical protein